MRASASNRPTVAKSRHKEISTSPGHITYNLSNLIQKVNGMEILGTIGKKGASVRQAYAMLVRVTSSPKESLQLERLHRYLASPPPRGAVDLRLPPRRPPSLQNNPECCKGLLEQLRGLESRILIPA